MPKFAEHSSKRTASPLERWIYQTIAARGMKAQYRIRGNALHLLCRQTPCPQQDQTLLWLLPILQATNFSRLLSPTDPPLYQVRLYGCEADDQRPRWTVTIYLNQIEQHLEHLLEQLRRAEAASELALASVGSQEAPEKPAKPSQALITSETMALALSNTALAKQGEERAIASYLSETLGELGVAVRVSAKVIPYKPSATVSTTVSPPTPTAAQAQPAAPLLTTKRLWVACEADYSPDPSLLCEPITQKLRQLEVEGFHDAVILFQVIGETKPDWTLRVDLTSPNEMLREWARWGDLEAIQRLLNQDIAALRLQITTATLNATTLHLCCSALEPFPQHHNPVMEQHKRAKADIALLLEAIAPQGIHAATLYGHLPQQEAPVWIEWLDLPATQHAAFAESTLALAKQADWEAIAFLLHRLLNPNLEEYLRTGGIRLQLLPKQDLLHVMSEASSCPDRQRVSKSIVRFLQQLELPQLSGVRVYGRRAGQKQPLWSYGSDFVARSRLVPEVVPEFAATETFVSDLLPEPGQPVLRPDLTPADLQQAWKSWQQRLRQGMQQVLLRSQLFTFAPHPDAEANALPGQATSSYGRQVALIWGAAGLLLLIQTNWLLGQLLHSPALQAKQSTPVATATPAVSPLVDIGGTAAEVTLPQSAAGNSGEEQAVFNTSSFTRSQAVSPLDAETVTTTATQKAGQAKSTLPYTPRSQAATLVTAEILAEGSPLPTFNSRQLDEKLLLYYRYLEKNGAPDVLIVGSSRALRGVDPITLEAELDELGYPGATVFNLGINGATAQVINLLIQQILTAEQLPRMILWADGARAFNSGTTDITYNGIKASPAYQELLAGTLAIPNRAAAAAAPPTTQPDSLNRTLTSSYQSIDRWLSQQLGTLSGTQPERDRLKSWLQDSIAQRLPLPKAPQPDSPQPAPTQTTKALSPQDSLTDDLGFLSLAMQFNPATYYQNYARVLGAYDGDYEDFAIQGEQEDAVRSLLKFTQASQIPVVFANLPLTEDYLDPVRLEHEQEFRDFMVQLSLEESGLIFRDLSERWTTQYSYFSDPSHLNRYGAYAVSVNLAQDAKIPWAKSTRPDAENALTSGSDNQARVESPNE